MKTITLTRFLGVAALFVLVSLLSGQKLEAQERVKIKTEVLTQDQLKRSSAPAPKLRSLTTNERMTVAQELLTRLESSPPANPTLGNSFTLKASTPRTDRAWLHVFDVNYYSADEDYFSFNWDKLGPVEIWFKPPAPGKYMFDFNVYGADGYTISSSKDIKFASNSKYDHLVVVADTSKDSEFLVFRLRSDNQAWKFYSCEVTQIK